MSDLRDNPLGQHMDAVLSEDFLVLAERLNVIKASSCLHDMVTLC